MKNVNGASGSKFKQAVMRLMEKEVTFEGVTFSVRPLNSQDPRTAMRLCAKHFVSTEREFVKEDLDAILKTPGLLEHVAMLGVDPATEAEKLLFVFESWQIMRLAMCCRIPDEELIDIFEMLRDVPEFRSVVEAAAKREPSPDTVKNA